MTEKSRVRTRRAVPEDIPAIGRLWRQMIDFHSSLDSHFALNPQADAHYEEHLSNLIEDYLFAVYVAFTEEGTAGYVIIAEMENPPFFEPRRYGFICEICVDNHFQGRGVGKSLVERAVRWCRRRQLKSLQLNTSPKNETALQFYAKQGFKPFLTTLWLDVEV